MNFYTDFPKGFSYRIRGFDFRTLFCESFLETSRNNGVIRVFIQVIITLFLSQFFHNFDFGFGFLKPNTNQFMVDFCEF